MGDIAPSGGDGIVNLKDFAKFASAWLSNPTDSNWNIESNLYPEEGDDVIDIQDFRVFVEIWLLSD